jgi:hypothetical protein
VDAFKQWRVYLEGTGKETQVRWAEELASYKFKIHYRKGSENGKADALSRRSNYLVKEGIEPAAILRIDNQETISCNTNFIAEITNYAVESVIEVIRNFYNNTTAGHKRVTQILNRIKKAGI